MIKSKLLLLTLVWVVLQSCEPKEVPCDDEGPDGNGCHAGGAAGAGNSGAGGSGGRGGSVSTGGGSIAGAVSSGAGGKNPSGEPFSAGSGGDAGASGDDAGASGGDAGGHDGDTAGGEGGEGGEGAAQPTSWGADVVEKAMQVCMQQETGLFKPDTQPEFESLMTRAWLRCDQNTMLGRSDTRGFELSSDGTWRFLLPDGEGLVRGLGFDNEGTWDVSDTTWINGPGWYQLNLTLPNGGDGYFATFSTTPAKVHLSSFTDSVYVPLP